MALLWRENRLLQRSLADADRGRRSALARERELNAIVADQHRRLLDSEAELETVRFRLSAVEMQLDGIDRLSRDMRLDLGLPPSEATWGDPGEIGPRQGGGNAPASSEAQRLDRVRRRLSFGLRDLEDILGSTVAADSPPGLPGEAAPPAPPLNWPARGQVTSGFGWRVFNGRPNFHTGVDVAARFGTPAQATGAGLVVGSGWQPGYGLSVLVQHSGGYHTLYAHLSELLVGVGDTVVLGTAVGLVGSSGNSTGPHLHYEIWKDGELRDPRPFMDGHPSQ